MTDVRKTYLKIIKEYVLEEGLDYIPAFYDDIFTVIELGYKHNISVVFKRSSPKDHHLILEIELKL